MCLLHGIIKWFEFIHAIHGEKMNVYRFFMRLVNNAT